MASKWAYESSETDFITGKKEERKGEEKRLRPSAVVRRDADGQKVIVESSSYTVRTVR